MAATVQRPWLGSLGAALFVFSPTLAQAASNGSSSDQGSSEMAAVVGLILIIGAAYLSTHFIVDWLQRRFLVISGLEYLLLGFLLGPAVLGAFGDLGGILPIVALAAGWVGLLRGTDFDMATLIRRDQRTARIVFLHHVIPGALVGFTAYYALRIHIFGLSEQDATLAAAFLGCCAAADSSEPFDLLTRRYEIGGKLAPLLKQATRMGDILIVIVFGLIFCVYHDEDPSQSLALSAGEWAWVMIGLGAVLGVVFTLFLAGDESDNSRFLALVGIIAFASGAAYFLKLSPLAVNLILGIVLVNLASSGHLVHATLESTERPMALVLMIFAGALWRPTELVPIVVGTIAFVLIRLVGKVIGSLLTGWGTSQRNDLFRGLLAHGEVTAAMAVSFILVYQGPAADLAYSIVLGSIVLHDLVAPRVLRGLLVDEGDLQREIKDSESVAAEAG